MMLPIILCFGALDLLAPDLSSWELVDQDCSPNAYPPPFTGHIEADGLRRSRRPKSVEVMDMVSITSASELLGSFSPASPHKVCRHPKAQGFHEAHFRGYGTKFTNQTSANHI